MKRQFGRTLPLHGRSGEAYKIGRQSVVTTWWLWLLIFLFPMVLRPWWVAIISIGLYVPFLRLVVGPFPLKRNSKWLTSPFFGSLPATCAKLTSSNPFPSTSPPPPTSHRSSPRTRPRNAAFHDRPHLSHVRLPRQQSPPGSQLHAGHLSTV